MSTVVVFEEFGGPEGLRVDDEEVGAPGPGQVRVANRVVGVNPADLKRLAGAFGGRVPGVLGFEAAGVVDAVGPAVPGLAPGAGVGWRGPGARRALPVSPRPSGGSGGCVGCARFRWPRGRAPPPVRS